MLRAIRSIKARLPLIRRLRADDRASTAVEFALVSVPFFTLLMGTIEVGMIFMGTTTLDNGVMDASRLIRTGQHQTTMSGDPTAFKNAICARVADFLDCKNKAMVDVRVYNNFSSANNPDPLADGQLKADDVAFQASSPGQIVVVRVFYEWAIVTPLIGQLMSNAGTSKRLLVATTAFRNEPFGL